MEWIGSHSSFDIEAEIARLGIGSHVKWAGIHRNPRELMENGAMFISTSREDPFPLVCLEAAERGLPIICFDERAGSMHQFVEDDAGIVVEHLNVDALANAVRTLLDDDGLRSRLGACAQAKVKQRHLTEAACPRIFELLPR